MDYLERLTQRLTRTKQLSKAVEDGLCGIRRGEDFEDLEPRPLDKNAIRKRPACIDAHTHRNPGYSLPYRPPLIWPWLGQPRSCGRVPVRRILSPAKQASPREGTRARSATRQRARRP